MPAWPGTLPGLNVDGYSEQAADGVVRTEIDGGPDFTRRRFTAVSTQIADNLVLTTTEVGTLQTFFTSTLAGGSLAFDWTHPRTGAAVQMRFLSPPAIAARSADLWAVSVSLEVLP